jgi:hypothetical protein
MFSQSPVNASARFLGEPLQAIASSNGATQAAAGESLLFPASRAIRNPAPLILRLPARHREDQYGVVWVVEALRLTLLYSFLGPPQAAVWPLVWGPKVESSAPSTDPVPQNFGLAAQDPAVPVDLSDPVLARGGPFEPVTVKPDGRVVMPRA